MKLVGLYCSCITSNAAAATLFEPVTAAAAAAAARGPVSAQLWLSEWRRLVAAEKITATTETESGRRVRYGLRNAADGEILEFCEVADTGVSVPLPGRTATVGKFSLILRANRALRPPAAPNFASLPPHDEAICSFCTGPLRLAARPMVAQSVLGSKRCWDVHYNISPQEPGGHFLLVPEIAVAANRRAQRLLAADCEDLIWLGRACERRLCVSYNAPNAGASQNHLHVHAWVYDEGKEQYAVTAAAPVESTRVRIGPVDACVLDWPAAAILLRGGTPVQVGAVLHRLCEQVPTHNVAVIGEETFVFLRSPDGQTSDAVPNLKIGSPQMLGHYVVDTAPQFEAATVVGAIEQSLRDTARSGDGGVVDAAAVLERVFWKM